MKTNKLIFWTASALRVAIIAGIALNVSLFSALAANLNFSWNASTSTNVTGYRLYYGTATGNYTSNVAVGNVTNATVTGLAQGATCYAAVSAVNAQGTESDLSSEVNYTIPAATSPAIVLSTPTNNATYSTTASIGLTASVTANGHAVNKVQFLNGTNLLAEVAASPYAFTWTNVAAGAYSLSARLVYDGASALNSTVSTVTVTGLPSPWQTADIGTTGLTGSVSGSSGSFTIKGGGVISGKADGFRFVYQTLSGDGEIRAQISSYLNYGTGGDTAVMIRESLTADSKYIMSGITTNGTFQWQNRTSTGGNSTSINSGTGSVPNTWVRLVRNGATTTAYYSADGTKWTRMGSVNVNTAANIYFGMVVSSGQTDQLNVSTFKNVTATP